MTQWILCNMFRDQCEFCSNETSRHPCTWVKREGSVFKPVKNGFIIRELGQLCNNAPLGEEVWVEKRHYCPVRWARVNKPVVEKRKRGRPKRKLVQPIKKRGRPKGSGLRPKR